jgi:hypothetical protein
MGLEEIEQRAEMVKKSKDFNQSQTKRTFTRTNCKWIKASEPKSPISLPI